jgi:acetylornithine deacetylase/succinyl-diaminopimelate desuccinylase-like protein
MKTPRSFRLIAGVILMAAASAAVAQGVATSPQSVPAERAVMAKPMPAPVDPQIAAALKQVSAAHIKLTIEKLVSFGTRLTIGENPAQSGRGVAAAREWIKSEFERYSQACGGCLEVKTDVFTEQPRPRVPKPTEIVNVYAVLRGTDPQAATRIVLVTGHYDSRPSNDQDTQADAPGANDDGSGTAVSLECARVLSKYKFPATIIFLTVAGEEQGLLGSAHFAEMAKQQGWNIEAVLNNDIVGGDSTAGQDHSVVRIFSEGIPLADFGSGRPAPPQIGASNTTGAAQPDQGPNVKAIAAVRALGTENDSLSREEARYIREVGALYLPASFRPMLVFRPDRFLRGGDHTSFNRQGFAAVRITEYRENYHHQHQTPRTENGIEYGDLPKFVDYEYMANVARLNAAVLASLASAPAPPASVRIETKKLENDSTLMWDPSPDGRASRYQVVSRATIAPDWERIASQVDGKQATIRVSKDNEIFGVRAVDAQGHRSLVVLPRP